MTCTTYAVSERSEHTPVYVMLTDCQRAGVITLANCVLMNYS